MKRLQTLCLAVVTLALTACQKDVDSISIDKSSTFSPKVAREFFEERQNSLITRGASFVSEVDNLLVRMDILPTGTRQNISKMSIKKHMKLRLCPIEDYLRIVSILNNVL